MKSDALTQGLGGARMRYSGPFVDAIGWGLVLEEAGRPRNVSQWREVLFGQRAMAPLATGAQRNAAGGPAVQPTAKITPVSRTGQPGTLAASTAAGRIERTRSGSAAAQASVRGASRVVEPGMFPWKTLVLAAAVIAMVGLGLRSLKPDPAARAAQRPTVVVLSQRQIGADSSPAYALVPPSRTSASDSNPGTVASEPQSVNPHPAANSTEANATTPGTVQPAAEPVSAENAHTAALAVEHRVEARFRAADLDGIGLTREQMAKNFPHLADRFDAMDTDHDGRVEASELMAALQHMTSQPRETQ
jgi:hypothetical protein